MMGDAALIATALHSLTCELQLIRMTLFTLCPDSDKDQLAEWLEKTEAKHVKGMKEIKAAYEPRD